MEKAIAIFAVIVLGAIGALTWSAVDARQQLADLKQENKVLTSRLATSAEDDGLTARVEALERKSASDDEWRAKSEAFNSKVVDWSKSVAASLASLNRATQAPLTREDTPCTPRTGCTVR